MNINDTLKVNLEFIDLTYTEGSTDCPSSLVKVFDDSFIIDARNNLDQGSFLSQESSSFEVCVFEKDIDDEKLSSSFLISDKNICANTSKCTSETNQIFGQSGLVIDVVDSSETSHKNCSLYEVPEASKSSQISLNSNSFALENHLRLCDNLVVLTDESEELTSMELDLTYSLTKDSVPDTFLASTGNNQESQLPVRVKENKNNNKCCKVQSKYQKHPNSENSDKNSNKKFSSPFISHNDREKIVVQSPKLQIDDRNLSQEQISKKLTTKHSNFKYDKFGEKSEITPLHSKLSSKSTSSSLSKSKHFKESGNKTLKNFSSTGSTSQTPLHIQVDRSSAQSEEIRKTEMSEPLKPKAKCLFPTRRTKQKPLPILDDDDELPMKKFKNSSKVSIERPEKLHKGREHFHLTQNHPPFPPSPPLTPISNPNHSAMPMRSDLKSFENPTPLHSNGANYRHSSLQSHVPDLNSSIRKQNIHISSDAKFHTSANRFCLESDSNIRAAAASTTDSYGSPPLSSKFVEKGPPINGSVIHFDRQMSKTVSQHENKCSKHVSSNIPASNNSSSNKVPVPTVQNIPLNSVHSISDIKPMDFKIHLELVEPTCKFLGFFESVFKEFFEKVTLLSNNVDDFFLYISEKSHLQMLESCLSLLTHINREKLSQTDNGQVTISIFSLNTVIQLVKKVLSSKQTLNITEFAQAAADTTFNDIPMLIKSFINYKHCEIPDSVNFFKICKKVEETQRNFKERSDQSLRNNNCDNDSKLSDEYICSNSDLPNNNNVNDNTVKPSVNIRREQLEALVNNFSRLENESQVAIKALIHCLLVEEKDYAESLLKRLNFS
ncbi:hypothetical protein Anas_12305 [Armadillidium nasatum]|uniref:Uncharacterized protein n=1 Tax=Armadillidium nasatum TaxID=96803 RepID=A0A5N5T4Y8_9CRUS|nr:hypothetical protein Anas_12305 [Armadillidium nasatum]